MISPEVPSKQARSPNPLQGDIFAGTPPLAFAYGLGGLLLFPLHARAATLLLENAQPDALVQAIGDYGVTILFASPTVYKALLERNMKRLRSLEKCVSAGETLSAQPLIEQEHPRSGPPKLRPRQQGLA